MYNSQSINQRLKNFAQKNNITNVERARVILCLERVIARLMQDDFLHKKLIFGGGFVIYKETSSQRFTTDVDAIISSVDRTQLEKLINKALQYDLGDGFWFGKTRVKELKVESGYGGIRFKIPYKAGLPHPTESEETSLRSVQLDISIGTSLEEYARKVNLDLSLSIFAPVEWNIYPLEFICAEKIHCLYVKGDLNTRGKDVFDLGFLLPQIDNKKLISAIVTTFNNRKDSYSDLFSKLREIDTKTLQENFKKSQFHKDSHHFDQCWQTILAKIQELDEL